MSHFTLPIWQAFLGLGFAITSFVVGLLVWPRLRRAAMRIGWFWLVPLFLALLVLFVFLGRRYPSQSLADTAVPDLFQANYWKWLFIFVSLWIGSTSFFLWQFVTSKRRASTARTMPGIETADLESAWDEVEVRLAQAQIDLAAQKVCLVLAPDEQSAESLISAVGARVFVVAPEGPSPLRVHALGDAVLLTCVGASVFGTGQGTAAARLDWLMQTLLAVNPDCPIVRGIAVLFPLNWCGRAEAQREAASVRDDMEVVRRSLKVRCPVYAIFVGMEQAQGFTEFVERLCNQVSPGMVDQRVGFAVPRSSEFNGNLALGGMTWMSGWVHNWILNLLAGQPFDILGNGHLITLDYEFRRFRKRLCSIMESAFSTPRDHERILFRGAYFVGTGDNRFEQAFAAGLFRGARSRILSDHIATGWSMEASREDRRFHLYAWLVSAVAALLCLLAWSVVIQRLPVLGWTGLLTLALIWSVGLWRLAR